MNDYTPIPTISSHYDVDYTTGEITNYYDNRPDPSVSEVPRRLCRGACYIGHILTNSEIIGYPDGNLITVNKSRIKLERQGGGIKQKITGFSTKSRRKLMQRLGMINNKVLPLWVTLTYPDEFDVDIVAMRKHFERFRRRLERKGWGAIWRKEWKQRKSGLHEGEFYPHYHLLVWGVDYFEFRAWVSRAWWEVCGKLSDNHLTAGTSTDMVDTWRKLVGYVSKYMAKTDDLLVEVENIGRCWGVINTDVIPWSEIIKWSLPNKSVNRLFRMMRRYANLKTFSSQTSLSILCNSPGQWLSASLRI